MLARSRQLLPVFVLGKILARGKGMAREPIRRGQEH